MKEVLEDEIGEVSALDNEVVQSSSSTRFSQRTSLSGSKGSYFRRATSRPHRRVWRQLEISRYISAPLSLVWIGATPCCFATRASTLSIILLNLILSCLAAVQAPIIMMSQNRAETRDRLRAENDYKVNLKAELRSGIYMRKSITCCDEQYNRLFEIQQIQIELLQEISHHKH